jgi:hypothetical protein
MGMQMDAYLKKEQIGTLFVLVGAPEGGLRGGGRGAQPQNQSQRKPQIVKGRFTALRQKDSLSGLPSHRQIMTINHKPARSRPAAMRCSRKRGL